MKKNSDSSGRQSGSKSDLSLNSGHRSRVRDRFRHNGFDGMHAYEVMEALLMLVLPRKDVKPLAKQLIGQYGSVSAVLSAPLSKLEKFPGLGSSSAVGLKMVMGACQYCLAERCRESRTLLDKPELIRDFARMKLGVKHHESYMLIFLDSRRQLIDFRIIAEGTIDYVMAYARNIVELAVELQAAAVILVHNHPSGVCTPSKEDLQATQVIGRALEIMGIVLLDHLIVTCEECFSFAANGVRLTDKPKEGTYE